MNPPQLEITQAGLLTGPFSCVLNMATGSGKTWLAQQAIRATAEAGGRAIYLTPLRALATEVSVNWSKSMVGIPVGVFTGDYGTNGKSFPVPFEKARVLVMTPERLDACTRAWRSHWSWIPEVDLLVIDEIHMLSESNRGPRLEGALSRFRRLNPFCRLVGLSATLGNPDELADWLDGVAYRSQWRPIPLEWRVTHFRKPSEKPAVLEREVARNVGQGGKSLVFVQSRRRAEELSRFLDGVGIRARHHHAGLDHAHRQDTESALRTGGVDVLVATGTLEMGLNLPVRQVVLYDLQTFDGRDFVPLSTNSVWQRVGRAGRPGLDEHGEAVLMCPNWDRHADHYQIGRFEPVHSQLMRSAALAEQIVAEVASGSATTRAQLHRAFRQSLAGHQGVIADLDRTVSTMCEAGLLREWNDPDRPRVGLVLKATKAGRVAVRHMLMPETILTIQRALREFPELTYLDLLVVMAAVADCEPVLTVDFEELDALAGALASEPSYLLRRPVAQILEILDVSSRRLLSCLKMANVMRCWTRLGDESRVAEGRDCYPFEVTRLAESMGRLLQATNELLCVTKEDRVDLPAVDDEPTQSDRIAALHRMVVFGLDESAVTLCFVPGIGGTFARRLVGHGVGDIEELAGVEPEDLVGLKGLSLKRARQWIEQAAGRIKSHHGLRLRDRGPRTAAKSAAWPHDIDPYRLRRSLELKVQRLNRHEFRVTGGLEPHHVTTGTASWQCDCMDHQRGNVCKHLLAVKGFRRDQTVGHLVQLLQTQATAEEVDLFRLWLSQEWAPRSTRCQ
jgi:helicase